jgi:protein SCO1
MKLNLKLIPLFKLMLFSTLGVGSWLFPLAHADQALVSSVVPKEIEGVGITEHLGQKLDLDLVVTDEFGTSRTLGSFFDGKTPVILSPVYYSCPGLCNFHLNGLTEGLRGVDWSPGQKFSVLAVSFDSKETPEVALAKKKNYMKIYDRPGTEVGWHFLTLNQTAVGPLMDTLGFRFKWDPEAKDWAHASAAIVVTPDGTISRYLPGIIFEARDLKLALNEATQGKIGNFIEGLILYCFQYNPHSSKYSLVAGNVMKLGGGLTILLLGLWLMPIWFRTKREQKMAGS